MFLINGVYVMENIYANKYLLSSIVLGYSYFDIKTAYIIKCHYIGQKYCWQL